MARVFVDAVISARFSCVVDAKNVQEAEALVKRQAMVSLDGFQDFEVDFATKDSQVGVVSSYKEGGRG